MKKILSLVSVLVVASALSASAQWYVEPFNNLAAELPGGAGFIPNSNPALTYSGMGISYKVSGNPGINVFGFTQPPGNTDWAVATADPFDTLKVQVLGGMVVGIKGDFSLTDSAGRPVMQGALGATVKLSDSTTAPFMFGSPYYAPAGLTVSEFWLNQLGADPNAFPTMDNFGVTSVVPEPGVILTNALVVVGALGGAWAYRRRKA